MAATAKTPEEKLAAALAKVAAAQKEVADAKLALFADKLDNVIATMQIPKLFEALKATGADDITALVAIGKAAGLKNLTITQEKTAKRGTTSAKPKSPESIALTKASVAALAAEKALAEAEKAAKETTGKTQPERVALKAAVEAARTKAVALRTEHANLKAANKAKREEKAKK